MALFLAKRLESYSILTRETISFSFGLFAPLFCDLVSINHIRELHTMLPRQTKTLSYTELCFKNVKSLQEKSKYGIIYPGGGRYAEVNDYHQV